MKVSEVKKGSLDSMGVMIEGVQAKYDLNYAVYRTKQSVLVHFADNATQEQTQRRALSTLKPLRGEINGLINGWHTSPQPELQARARRFERRVGDALVVALEGDIPDAALLLEAIKADLIARRLSIGRFQYLEFSSLTVLAVLASVFIGSWVWSVSSTRTYLFDDQLLFLAAAVGALGAFFSIATAIRDRSIQTDLHWRDNLADSVLRIVIGVIAAPVFISLLLSNAVSFNIGDLNSSGLSTHWQPTVVVAFLAGFSERLVGTLLGKVAAGGSESAPPSPSETMAANKPRSAPPTNARAAGSPSGGEALSPSPDDGCLSSALADPKNAAADVDLPATIAGQVPR